MSEVVSTTNSEYLDAITMKRVVQRGSYPFIIHDDQSVSMVIPFKSFDENANETKLEEMKAIFEKILAKLDPSISLQILIKREEEQNLPEGVGLPPYLEPRIEYLKELRKKHQIFTNRYFISFYIKAEIDESQGNVVKKFLNKFSKVEDTSNQQKKVAAKIEDRLERAAMLHDEIINQLTAMGIQCNPITDTETLFRLLLHFFNPITQNKKIVNKTKDDLLKDIRLKVRKKDFLLDGFFHKVWTLDRLPEQKPGKTIDLLRSVPVEFLYSLTMAKDFKGDTFRMTNNFVLRVRETLREEMAQRNGVSKEQTARLIENDLMDSVLATFGGTEWATEDQASWNLFCFLVPGFSCLNNIVLKSMTVPKEIVSNYLPLIGGEQNEPTKDAQFFLDLRGYMKSFPLKEPSLDNWNYLFLGDKGSGKTTLIQTLLSSNNIERTKVFVLTDDTKNAYENMAQLVGGKVIRLSEKNRLAINIFDVKNKETALANKIQNVYSMLELILSQTSNRIDIYNFLTRETLLSAVEKTFNSDAPSLEKLISEVSGVLDLSDNNHRRLLTRLENFFGDAEIKRMFTSPTEIDLSGSMTIVDVHDLYIKRNKADSDDDEKLLLQKIYYIAVSDLFAQSVKSRNGIIVKEDSPTFYSLMKNSFMNTLEVEMQNFKKEGIMSFYTFEHLDKIQEIEGLYDQLMPLFSRIFITKNSEDFNVKKIMNSLKLNKSILPKMKVLGYQKRIQRDGSLKVMNQFFMVIDKKGINFFQNVLSPYEKLYISPGIDEMALVDYYKNSYPSYEATLRAISTGAFMADTEFLDYLEQNGFRNLARKVKAGEY